MDEDRSERSRHNSGRSRHGSGRSRHGSGDLWRRLDSEASPNDKLSKPGKDSPRIHGKGVAKEEDRIALIKDKGAPIENGIGESPLEECNGHCTGHCGGLCTPDQVIPVSSTNGKRWRVNAYSEKMPSLKKDLPAQNTAPVANGPRNGKKTSDSEGESDCHGNGVTDGEDDHQLLIKMNRAGSQLPSPHRKNRIRHHSEGLRKRTRSQSDSECSEPVLPSGGIENVAPVMEHKSVVPARTASAPSRRRHNSSKCHDAKRDSAPVHHGSLGSTLAHTKEKICDISPRKRHCSQGSADSTVDEGLHWLQDNPSFAHNSSGNSEEDEAKAKSQTLVPSGISPTHTAVHKPMSDGDQTRILSSPRPDEMKMLISGTAGGASKTILKLSESPRPRLGLNLPHVCRPRDDSDPPLPIIHQDDSFSPRNHMDANIKLNEVNLAVTENHVIQNGDVWQMQTLPDGEIQMNGHLPSGKNVEFTSSVSSTSNTDSFSTAKCRAYSTLAVLLLANLINYMDRVTIAGMSLY